MTRIHSRSDIADGDRDLCGLIRISCQRDQGCFSLNEQVVGFCAAVRTILSVSRDSAIHHARIKFLHGFIFQSEPGDRFGRKIMDEYIRRLHQLFENFDALLRFYVKSKALLVAVKPHEGRAQTPRRGIPLSGYIADAWPLDLYHFSSKI